MNHTDTVSRAQDDLDRFRLCGSVLDAKYRVDRVVAEGGFGVVYQGVHLRLDAQVAIKVLKVPEDLSLAARDEFMQKFVLEAQTIAKLRHPAIVQVLDTGASVMPNGLAAPWMALEWLTGQSLETVLLERRGRPYSVREALIILRPAIEALAVAHDEGVAHRDIKPANMMVVSGKRGATLRLLDFGIAKVMEEGESVGSGFTRTRSALNAFSPQYAAPEQIGGARTGPWTDVHAIGLILTEMLTGRAPYECDDITELLAHVLRAERPTPARCGIDAGGLEPVIARAVAFKPDERFRTCVELLEAIEHVVPSAGQATIPPGLLAPFSASHEFTPAPRAVVPPSRTNPAPIAPVANGFDATAAVQPVSHVSALRGAIVPAAPDHSVEHAAAPAPGVEAPVGLPASPSPLYPPPSPPLSPTTLRGSATSIEADPPSFLRPVRKTPVVVALGVGLVVVSLGVAGLLLRHSSDPQPPSGPRTAATAADTDASALSARAVDPAPSSLAGAGGTAQPPTTALSAPSNGGLAAPPTTNDLHASARLPASAREPAPGRHPASTGVSATAREPASVRAPSSPPATVGSQSGSRRRPPATAPGYRLE